MNKSESIAELATALAKAQGEIKGAVKDSSNPFFKSSYADLASVWDACRKPLSDNGLAVIQTMDFLPDNPEFVVVDTTLTHSSGQWISGRLVVKPVKSDPQGSGSCITYLRRYSLQSIVGIAPEDDDGNAASGKEDKNPPMKYNKSSDPKEGPEDIPEPDMAPEPPPAPVDKRVISEAQGKRFFAIAKEAGWADDALKAFLTDKYQITSSKMIPSAQYDAIIEEIRKGSQL